MRELIIVPLIVVILIIFIALYLMTKEFMDNLKSKRLFQTTLFIIMASLAGTYSLALFLKNYDIAEKVGSADAWIGFAGSAMGGLITMLALYFTLIQNQEMALKLSSSSKYKTGL